MKELTSTELRFARIQEVEDQVKDLHFNPRQKKHSMTEKATAEFFGLFWNIHVQPVIQFAREMARKYGGDEEIVWLAGMFHDIARLDDVEPHEEIGAQQAYEILLEKGLGEGIAQTVKDTIATHRATDQIPKTLEQKILATADAVAHFKTPFYMWFATVTTKPFPLLVESTRNKIARDYNDKIFFEDEKKLVTAEYEVLNSWVQYSQTLPTSP